MSGARRLLPVVVLEAPASKARYVKSWRARLSMYPHLFCRQVGRLRCCVEVLDVASLELNILFLAGPTGTPCRALNAHCVYEVL